MKILHLCVSFQPDRPYCLLIDSNPGRWIMDSINRWSGKYGGRITLLCRIQSLTVAEFAEENGTAFGLAAEGGSQLKPH